jgi:DNA polymerase III gamma/tau subunit
MGFDQFLGNKRIVGALRGMLRRERVPSALLFTGPRGVGKFTLARKPPTASACRTIFAASVLPAGAWLAWPTPRR